MIYFCIPAFNEERTVGVVLWKLRQVMTELQRDFQIIVVDDASTDGTQEVLNPYARVLPLTLVRNEKQLGYAAAMEIAIREAVRRSPYPKRDAVITLQADFTEDPDVVPALIKRVEAGADLVASTPTFDESTPPNIRRGRRFFRWLVRGREWAEIGDPFSGMRAYRVMTLKRAMETRGTARLLSWEGVAANAELLVQSIPHSRRNDTVESVVHYKRLQRESRFRFFPMLSQVMGMRSGKPGKAAPVQLPETTIVVPAALAVELATTHRRDEARRRPPARRGREVGREAREPRRTSNSDTRRRPDARKPDQTRKRDEQRPGKRTRPPRPQADTAIAAAAAIDVVAEPGAIVPAPEKAKKRRRPRRRSRKSASQVEQSGTTVEATEVSAAAEDAAPVAENGTAETAAQGARKRSRRGRRGGRGRKRGPRTANEEQLTNNSGDGAEEAAALTPPHLMDDDS